MKRTAAWLLNAVTKSGGKPTFPTMRHSELNVVSALKAANSNETDQTA
jgi:hypothetical protein